jgi:protein O-GlcNAc transferase
MSNRSAKLAVVQAAALPTDDDLDDAVRARNYALALRLVAKRLRADPLDAEALYIRGACAMAQRDLPKARRDFASLTNRHPQVVRFRTAQAAACLAGGRFEEGLALLEQSAALNPKDIPTQINRLQALLRLDRVAEAFGLVQALADQDPTLPETRQLMGEVLRRLYKFDAAISWLQAWLDLDPTNPAPRIDIALCVHHMGDHAVAQRMMTDVLADLPADVPQDVLARLVLRAQEGGALTLALLGLRHAVALYPDDETLNVNLGMVLNGMGQSGEALYFYTRVLKAHPDVAGAHFHAAMAYLAQRKQADAQKHLERCVEIEPSNSAALAQLANLKRESGQPAEAVKLLERAVRHDKHLIDPVMQLMTHYKDASNFDEAERWMRRAEALQPGSPHLKQARADLQLRRGDIAGANEIFRELLANSPNSADAVSGLLFCSNYDPVLTPEQVADAYRQWDERFVRWRLPAELKFDNTRKPRRKLRVGYVSGDLRMHSVIFFFEPLLTHHDRSKFDIFLYANQKHADPVTRRLMDLGDQWRWTVDLSDEAMAELIRLDQIDILIDLSNHTGYNRLMLFGRKPAPIQMTTIGMPTTTGLSAMDWRITDAYMDPPGITEHLHSEKLLRILSHWCYRPSDDAVDLPVAPTPALKNGYITFASFNAFGKINSVVLGLWGRVLRAIPGSKLIVATGAKADDKRANALVRRTCKAAGIPLDQLVLMERKPLKDYYGSHDEVDILLDSFPYTGATVTAHSLWMGVPVITLAGPSPIHRSATSMMSSVGLPEFVADSHDAYVAIAKRWAADIPALADIRAGMRERMKASPLMDGARVTKDLEAKLRSVWRDWCEAQSPSPDGKAAADRPANAATDVVAQAAAQKPAKGRLRTAEAS